MISETNLVVAKSLLQAGALNVNLDGFTLSSGMISPVYMDCRKVMAHPKTRAKIINAACDHLMEQDWWDEFDVVAGGETAGIPFAAWIADHIDAPMQYVRKKPKGYGRNAQIEGDPQAGQRVLLVEDLATTGKSLRKFVDGVRVSGQVVDHALVMFDYNGALGVTPSETMRNDSVTLLSLSNWSGILANLEDNRDDTYYALADFLANPTGWKSRK